MHPSQSILRTAIEQVRQVLNEATFDAKYDDDYIVRSALSEGVMHIFSRINAGADAVVCCRFPLTLVTGQEYYQLPAHVLQVLRIVRWSSTGNLEADWRPRSDLSASGPGWILEGNTLRVTPPPVQDQELTIVYIPTGNWNMHYGENAELTTATNVTTFELLQTPTNLMGTVGQAENEYAGQILRLMTPNGRVFERVIESFDAATSLVTMRLPIEDFGGTVVKKYEVVPLGIGPMWTAAATYAAIVLGTGRKISGSHMDNLRRKLQVEIKTVRDTYFHQMARYGKAFDRKTIDNPDGNMSMTFFHGM